MAQDSSIAPKERINIRYKPSSVDVKEDIELPLKMVVLGEFSTEKSDTPLSERKRINIDKDNFSDAMRSQNLKLELSTKNHLSEGLQDGRSDQLHVSLNINTLADFSPDSIARQVPELHKLLELRNALLSLKGPLGNMPAFRKILQSMLDDEETRQKLLAELEIKSAD